MKLFFLEVTWCFLVAIPPFSFILTSSRPETMLFGVEIVVWMQEVWCLEEKSVLLCFTSFGFRESDVCSYFAALETTVRLHLVVLEIHVPCKSRTTLLFSVGFKFMFLFHHSCLVLKILSRYYWGLWLFLVSFQNFQFWIFIFGCILLGWRFKWLLSKKWNWYMV